MIFDEFSFVTVSVEDLEENPCSASCSRFTSPYFSSRNFRDKNTRSK
jgi:hypothetical protein